jgi:predicted RND superfamily exporter protein
VSRAREIAAAVVGERRRLVILGVLVATLVLGAGAPAVDLSTSLEQFRGGTEEAAADNYIEANMSGSVAGVERSLLVIRNTNESATRQQRSVLDKEDYLQHLRLQRALRNNATVNRTLTPEQRPLSIANVVAIIAIEREKGTPVDEIRVEPRPSLDRQIAAMRNVSTFQNRIFTSYAVGTVLSDVSHTWPAGGGFAFVPTTYEANGKTASATAFVVSHEETTDPENLTAAQTAMADIANQRLESEEIDALAVGNGMVNAELRQSSLDSLTIVGPVAAMLVLLVMLFAYRDVLDTLLGVVGLGVVMLWTFGFMGWMGITFNQLFVAVPVLLMGLSIDYAIHVFMRHREERPPVEPETGSRDTAAGREALADGGRDTGEDSDAGDDTAGDTDEETGGFVFGDEETADDTATDETTTTVEDTADDSPTPPETPDRRDRSGSAPTGRDDPGRSQGTVGSSGETGRSGGGEGGRGDGSRGGGGSGGSGGSGGGGDGNGGEDDGPLPDGVKPTMGVAVASVGTALALVTLTTATGFLSNLVSGVGPIREFGVVSAVGIVAAFVAFALFIPALKVEVDGFLEARGADRRMRPFGNRGGFESFLSGIVTAARRVPWAVAGLAVLATVAGTIGATQVPNTFEQDDLLVDDGDVPDWTEDLPAVAQPGNYTAQDDLDYVEEGGFIYDGTFTEYLVRGDVTDPDTLDRVDRASRQVNDSEVAMILPDKFPGTRNPITMMHAVANRNESFNRTYYRHDTDGDGVPEENLTAVYDAFYEAAPNAAPTMVDRRNGEYVALRVKIPVNGTYSETRITEEVRNATGPVQGEGLRTVPTGQPVKNQAVASQLLTTVNQGLTITLAVVLVILTYVYRRTQGYPSLGVVTLLPIGFALAWILGTMYVLGIPFNVMTALITSFTIGIGVDYSIHLSERYMDELREQGSMAGALETAVLGTGGAMLGSAITDIAGVGVLAFAILEPLQQFGIITALTIAYSFLAAVVVLPALLVIWTRRYGPDDVRGVGASEARAGEREVEPMSVD